MRIEVSVEQPEILGTSGGLAKAREFFRGCGTLLMVNSDILHTADLGHLVEYHQRNKALATMLLYDGPGHEKYPHIGTDGQGQLCSFVERQFGATPLRKGSFTGIHIFDEAIFDFIPPNGPSEINALVYPRMIEAGKPVFGCFLDAYWNDLGTPTSCLQAHHDALDGLFDVKQGGYLGRKDPASGWYTAESSAAKHGTTPCYIAPTARIDRAANIGSHSVIMKDVEISSEATIERSVVLPDTKIPSGCKVNTALVGPATNWESLE
jgi:NDP-sugar pyrophosphorylase family protein